MRALVYKLSDGRVVKTLAEAREAKEQGLTYKEQLIPYDLDAEREAEKEREVK
jgi:hypothetical protein